jgi:hypothetical protein
VELRPGLVLAGVDDLTSRRRRPPAEDPIGAALAGRPPGAAVLLSHSPLELERAAAAGAGLVLSGHTHGGQIWPFGYLVRRSYPYLAGLPEVLDGSSIVALSDFHLGSLLDGEWLAARVAQVEALRPDVVVLLGDLLEGHGAPPPPLAQGLGGFRAPLGVFAVTGNHEYHGRRDGSVRFLEEAGVRVLRDRWVELRPGLVLAGVDDLTSRRRRPPAEDPIGAALAGRPPGAAVLLSHSPLELERAAAAGADLVLSGHTHGGQIWPFGYLVRRSYPRFVGRYEVGGATVIVGRGTGTWGPRMRLWRRGEVLKVILRSR